MTGEVGYEERVGPVSYQSGDESVSELVWGQALESGVAADLRYECADGLGASGPGTAGQPKGLARGACSG